MRGLFLLGLAGFLGTWATAATGGRGLLFIGVGSAALNLLSWYAIRRGQSVEPHRFPVRWRGKGSDVKGTTVALLFVVMCALCASLGTSLR